MKLIIVALAFVALAAAAPADKEPTKILRSDFQSSPDGAYQFAYETDDGSSRSETGEVKEALDEDNKPHSVVVMRGTFSYVNLEGKTETINYFADETGFHAEGDSIPKSPSRR